MTTPPVLIVGEALIDVIHQAGRSTERPGGSPANVAVTLGRLGREPHLVTTMADDAHGELLRAWLISSGVHVATPKPGPRYTSVAEAAIAPDGAAEYKFDLEWDIESVPDASSSAIFHTGSIATVLEPGADVVERAMRDARPHALVTFDPNARPAITPNRDAVLPRVERLVGLSDVVKVSDEDLRWYYPDSDIRQSALRWAASGPALVIVTLGAEGCLLIRDGVVTPVPGRATVVADTVGAGDTFMGALLDAFIGLGAHGASGRHRLERASLTELLEAAAWASAAAAITVSRPGADPPTRAELLAKVHN